jgi:hypothetical protein
VAIFFALLIFAALSAGCWFISVAAYRSSVTGHDPAAVPSYGRIVGWTIAAAAFSCLVPNPGGFLAGLVIWAIAVFGFVTIPAPRRVLLFFYLAIASVFARLIVGGILDNLK